ncbi:MAG: hypothetical protein IJD43_09975 [Thermoguttaceae bacterium]|nr:hypothetical protein [Thermoguttaceae bacterium]
MRSFMRSFMRSLMRSFMRKLCGIALCVSLTVPAIAQDPTFVWTGNGTDDLISNSANWPASMASQFFQNGYGLHTTGQRGTYIIPAGNTMTAYGFDNSNITLDFCADITSIRNNRFNGFWMRNNMTVILGPSGSFTFLNLDGSADSGQITMQGANNRLDYSMPGTLSLADVHVSSHDGNGGRNNHLNQYAGTINAAHVWLGTNTQGGTEVSSINLYGGSFNVIGRAGESIPGTICIGYHAYQKKHGNGALNIYGGAFTAGKIEGDPATLNGETYTPSVNLFIGGTDGTQFGTFTATQQNTFTGDFNVQMAMPLTVLDPSILNTNIVSLPTVGNAKVNLKSALFTTANDGKNVVLNAAKELAGANDLELNSTLELTTSVSEGWIELPGSSNPFVVELSTSGLGSMTAAEEFAAWLGTDFFANTVALDPSTIQLSFAPETSGDIFMFDFTNYVAANVTLQGFSTSELPEPSAWALMLFGAAGLFTFFRKPMRSHNMR